jgi:hypothetical protein
MKKIIRFTATMLLGAGMLAGCSGSGSNQQSSATTTIAGKVADGYLVNATVFLDKNANYQLDSGEPNTTTGSTGSFTLTIDPADAGKYPIVALAIKDQTTDLDNPTVKLGNTYVLSMHALTVTPSISGSVTGTVSNFISPISTMIRETMVANPSMTLTEASVQVRNQLDLSAEVKIHGDYIFGSYSGAHKSDCQKMHQAARRMASLMGEQDGLVMNGKALMIGRYRQMIGQIGDNIPQIVDGYDLADIRERLRTTMESMPTTAPFRNISSLFTCYTSQRNFWNMSSGRMVPRHPRW